MSRIGPARTHEHRVRGARSGPSRSPWSRHFRRVCHEIRMDYRRAGLSRQPEQCRRRLVRPSWSWLQQLLRSRAELLRSGPVLCRSRGLLQLGSQLLRSRGSGLLRSGRSGLLRSGSGLLRSDDLLRSLQQLLQAEEMQEELVQGLQARRLQEEQVLPDELLRSDLLCSGRSGLLRPGCSQLLRSGRVCADLCRSDRVLLPLVKNSELPGVG